MNHMISYIQLFQINFETNSWIFEQLIQQIRWDRMELKSQRNPNNLKKNHKFLRLRKF